MRQLHSAETTIRVELVSAVRRIADQNKLPVSSLDADQAETAGLAQYSLKSSPDDDHAKVVINHVVNLAARHVRDTVRVEVVRRKANEEKVLATADLEISKLGLHDGRTTSLMIIATGPQSFAKGNPQYFKIEVDVLFNSKGGGTLGRFEMAKRNYMLMMGKAKLTPMEEAILQMMIERQELGASLTQAKLRIRKAVFFMRNLQRIEYSTVSGDRQVRLLVSPLTFLFQVFTASSFSQAYDHYRVQHLRQMVEAELEKCAPKDPELVVPKKDNASGGSVDFNEGTVLRITMPTAGIDLETFGIKRPNEEIEFSKLEFMLQVCEVSKPAQVVFRRLYTEHQLLSKPAILQGEVIAVENVPVGAELKFSVNVAAKGGFGLAKATKRKDVFKPFGSAGSIILSEHQA